MTPLIIGTALALLALDSGPATSQPTTVSPAVVAGQKVDDSQDPDKVICKNQALTGSRFTKRVCMTREEWTRQQEQTEVLERRINQAPTAMGGGGMSGR